MVGCGFKGRLALRQRLTAAALTLLSAALGRFLGRGEAEEHAGFRDSCPRYTVCREEGFCYLKSCKN